MVVPCRLRCFSQNGLNGGFTGRLIGVSNLPCRRKSVPFVAIVGKLDFELGGEKCPNLRRGIVAVLDRRRRTGSGVTTAISNGNVELQQITRGRFSNLEADKLTAESFTLGRTKRHNHFFGVGFGQRDMNFVAGNGDAVRNPDLRRSVGYPIVGDDKIPRSALELGGGNRFSFTVEQFQDQFSAHASCQRRKRTDSLIISIHELGVNAVRTQKHGDDLHENSL